MPIYEYYCPGNNKIYQFYAKTLAQGRTTPKCPDGAGLPMKKMLSAFSVGSRSASDAAPAPPAEGGSDDPRLDSAMSAMEGEFAQVDENDPRALGRMVRRMSELTGEKIEGEMEEMVRKLEEGADPEALEEQMGGTEQPGGEDPSGAGEGPPGPPRDPQEPRGRLRARRGPPVRDPKLYDYESSHE